MKLDHVILPKCMSLFRGIGIAERALGTKLEDLSSSTERPLPAKRLFVKSLVSSSTKQEKL